MVLGMTGEDKASCLQRQAQNAQLKAKEEICAKEGRRFKQPSRTLGICNALQLDKGRMSPHQINEYAAAFVLERDNSAPNDIGKMWLTRIDAAPLYIVKSFLSDASFATATKNNMIFVWLMESDPKLFMLSMVESAPQFGRGRYRACTVAAHGVAPPSTSPGASTFERTSYASAITYINEHILTLHGLWSHGTHGSGHGCLHGSGHAVMGVTGIVIRAETRCIKLWDHSWQLALFNPDPTTTS
ncbi:hypothetical protein CPB85DRAFT_1255156 [Mucidula mucida]|nr:hypothetical protein CPB85DRAFT_1255156 [Mucidula mucida]